MDKLNNRTGEGNEQPEHAGALSLDTVDYRILHLLSHNPELTYRKLASQLEKSPATVLNRLRQLRKSGVIKGQQLV
ncbi:TPA: Lrp/AsnC family transcriptional regulator, partial [Candidatus Woesearchaeota archaeon]|nr:Lrp/AsnC family transcriptional regulator [Candidatus Woesearchaeota archaeon]